MLYLPKSSWINCLETIMTTSTASLMITQTWISTSEQMVLFHWLCLALKREKMRLHWSSALQRTLLQRFNSKPGPSAMSKSDASIPSVIPLMLITLAKTELVFKCTTLMISQSWWERLCTLISLPLNTIQTKSSAKLSTSKQLSKFSRQFNSHLIRALMSRSVISWTKMIVRCSLSTQSLS